MIFRQQAVGNAEDKSWGGEGEGEGEGAVKSNSSAWVTLFEKINI